PSVESAGSRDQIADKRPRGGRGARGVGLETICPRRGSLTRFGVGDFNQTVLTLAHWGYPRGNGCCSRLDGAHEPKDKQRCTRRRGQHLCGGTQRKLLAAPHKLASLSSRRIEIGLGIVISFGNLPSPTTTQSQ